MERGAGILLPVSSIPSKYGIGSLGREAYKCVDMLAEAGQKYWQVLPVGPTSYGDSPYQSFSAFAGNPYFIDLELIMEEGLLSQEELQEAEVSEEEAEIDYERLFLTRFDVLRKAYLRSNILGEGNFALFQQKQKFWLRDYALFMALKEHFGQVEWSLWQEDIKFHEEEAVCRYSQLLEESIGFYEFLQYKFYQQWEKLRKYANDKGIKVIGDIPLYVAMDSADVWVHNRLFELDERRNPIHVAGVPPDIFSETGQRWGNPLYRWDVMEKEEFMWWHNRMSASAALYDVIRIDHFIGIVRYYSIPFRCPTAIEGDWKAGPGKKLVDTIVRSVGNSEIIAEDLGIVVPAVRELMENAKWPGMKVLLFAFDGNEWNEHLPKNFATSNMIVYGGTHDNDTIMGFLNSKTAQELHRILQYLHVATKEEAVQAMFEMAYKSIANVAIFQIQDVLKLGNNARMNEPSTLGKNWKWRMRKGQFTKKNCGELKKLTLETKR
ncbi:4-alpha-glucanotransferase [Anaeromicropila populeti]|uniref:4-alpha-glucanotransferase n=1 Tax=Anaeromicropila populeti TaxID=37658 RepID=A0A1I6LCZ8_9FIRM|nr:4-alpha-glucanotransferase [Anaeromicropila populeti]SFS01294.1 4-alpha-glucanotransferase [Anaeromicropila populeti]